MSDSLRVRLEFNNFSNPDLRNSLLSFKKSETKNVKSLQQLIQKRFNLQQNILLSIDGFTLEPTETIDVVRDNDMIVIEPKIEILLTKVKTEPKSQKKSILNELSFSSYFSDKRKSGVLPKIETNVKSETTRKPKADSKIKSNEFGRSSDSSSSEEPKVKNTESGIKLKAKTGGFQSRQKHIETDIKPSNLELSKLLNTPVVQTINKLDEPDEVFSNRNIPLRQAFKSAATSIKKRPQTKSTGGITTTTTTTTVPTTSDAPKPKKKRSTKEAKEPVDRFSPIIILKRQHYEENERTERKLTEPVNKEIKKRQQSARKSFPNPSRNGNIVKDNNSKKTEENSSKNQELSDKTIDFENCEPLASTPTIGDIIAFKMLTLSADGNGYESSLFQMGSVLNVNEETQMVDILLQDVIKRKNIKTLNKSDEQIFGIHSLKINWSTVLEPKIIQRKSESEIIIL